MKRILLIILAVLLLPGCNVRVDNGTADAVSGTSAAQGSAAPNEYVHFYDWYARTDGNVPGKQYPVTTVIRSEEEMIKYFTDNRDKYDFGEDETYPDDMETFTHMMAMFDDNYFQRNVLVLILLSEPSSTTSHKVRYIKTGTSGVDITVERQLRGFQNKEEAQWHILIEFEKEYAAGGVRTKIVDDVLEENAVLPFTAQYIRSYGFIPYKYNYPPAVIVRSVSELKKHFSGERGIDSHEGFYTDESLDRYDDAFFADKALMLIWFRPDSGCTRYNVESVVADSIGLTVNVKRIHLPIDDYGDVSWNIAVPIDKKYAGSDVRVEETYENTGADLKPGEVSYVRVWFVLTSGNDSKGLPPAAVIRSLSEYEDFYTPNKEALKLDINEHAYPYVRFDDIKKLFNKDYFEHNTLILVPIEQPVMAINHNVMSVTVEDGKAVVYLERPAPETLTGEMAKIYILIGVEGEYGIDDVSVEFIDETPMFSESVPLK